MKKALYIDISGTLIPRSEDKNLWIINGEIFNWIQDLIEGGFDIFILTGRYSDIAIEIYKHLNLHNRMFLSESGLIYNKGTIEDIKTFNKEDFVKKIINKDKLNVGIGDSLSDSTFMNMMDESYLGIDSDPKLMGQLKNCRGNIWDLVNKKVLFK